MSPWPLVASFSLPNTSSNSIVLSEALPEYCSSINTTPSCCCWCHLPQPLLPPLLDQEEETWLFRTCVERGGAVRSAQVIGDLDHVEYDYIITLQASARDLQVVCRCKLSP